VSDLWAQWLRVRRTGGSEEERRALLDFLAPTRDQVIEGAELKPGDVLLDVGCGDGLIGLGALERGARVIFSDVSESCLQDCREVAGTDAEYLLAPATDLGEVVADVVTTRSVLIYVHDKRRAFREFFRVLRPGGRISLFEPINRFGVAERRRTLGFQRVSGVEDLVARVLAEMDRVQEEAGGIDPMLDFDERDLVAFAEDAGFINIRLTLNAEVTEEPMWQTRDWGAYLNSSPNPLAPTLLEAIEATLTPDEATRLIDVLRPQVEQGEGKTRFARAFLTAHKPAT
jgi:SAM-dependent methyltransferase